MNQLRARIISANYCDAKFSKIIVGGFSVSVYCYTQRSRVNAKSAVVAPPPTLVLAEKESKRFRRSSKIVVFLENVPEHGFYF